MSSKIREKGRIVPFNEREAVIEPFWDRHLSGISFWDIETPGKVTVDEKRNGDWRENIAPTIYVYGDSFHYESTASQGLKIYQTWCNVTYEWNQKPIEGAALEMKREFNLALTGYDHLIICMTIPPRSNLKVSLETDIGLFSESFAYSDSFKKEFRVDLRGAAFLKILHLELRTESDEISKGYISWIGLGEGERDKGRGIRSITDSWSGYLLSPHLESLSFESQFGLILDNSDIALLQEKYRQSLNEGEELLCVSSVRDTIPADPEKSISSHVKLWLDNRFNRTDDHSKVLLGFGYKAALAGVVARDRELLKLAARYALSLAFTPSWHDSFICTFPGSNFEHKGFTNSLCSFESAVILDLAWEFFTPNARELIMRRIGESGLGNLNWTIWKHGEAPEKIFEMNQLSWFTPGRMAGSLLLENVYKNVLPYTDIYYSDLVESINACILPDGGYQEGAGYFTTIARSGALSIYLYGKNRREDFHRLLPESLKKTGDFIEVFESTDCEKDIIPIFDSRPLVDVEYPLYMASLLPDSRWTALYRKIMERSDGRCDSVMGELFASKMTGTPSERKAFIHLRDMGFISSLRSLSGGLLKIVIIGNRETEYHSHEDKGSFVLEFADETFFMDPGVGDYADPQSSILSFCQNHNMLIPLDRGLRPAPVHPLPHEVKPRGFGDEHQFHASIDLTGGWEKYYRHWSRSFTSSDPRELIIRDEFELEKGEGVKFTLNTSREVSREGEYIAVSGKRGVVEIAIPEGCDFRVESVDSILDSGHKRIILEKKEKKGELAVHMNFRFVGDTYE